MTDEVQDGQSLTLNRYQNSANETNVIVEKPATLLLLGLFGEVGSLVSELKKKQRDEEAYIRFATTVVEELGDALWYLACLSTHVNLSLEAVARIAFPNEASAVGNLTFHSIQQHATISVATSSRLEASLIKLSSQVGYLLSGFLQTPAFNHEGVPSDLAAVFKSLVEAAVEAQVSLAVAAENNLKKIFDRWPQKRDYPILFDEGHDRHEQLPRCIKIRISERVVGSRTYVYQQCNGVNIGDRITDNKEEEDDYRFHDVFHLAYAAVLGWSPVTRALFKVKRKSAPKIDENEDGARAIITEEAISAWIFHHAVQLNYFQGLKSLEYGLLKLVRNLSKGYEVDKCPLWLWEEAILQGYAVFRELRSRRQGIVVASLTKRKLEFREMTDDPI